MPHEETLPPALSGAGWKVKIRENERLEPPHVTVLHGPNAWRWNLREEGFLDREPPARQVPKDLLNLLKSRRKQLVEKWNEMYPENPV